MAAVTDKEGVFQNPVDQTWYAVVKGPDGHSFRLRAVPTKEKAVMVFKTALSKLRPKAEVPETVPIFASDATPETKDASQNQSNNTETSVQAPKASSNVTSEPNKPEPASKSEAQPVIQNGAKTVSLLNENPTCTCKLCSLDPSKYESLWNHSRTCLRPLYCEFLFCEELKKCDTDDFEEAFVELNRNMHVPQRAFNESKVPRIEKKHRLLDDKDSACPLFMSDKEFFGTEHIIPGSVLMTGHYDPVGKCLVGRWSNLAQSNERTQWFRFDLDTDDVVEDDRACTICGSADDTINDGFIVCDLCDQPYHLGCVGLDMIPDADWFCQSCVLVQRSLGYDIPPSRRWRGAFDVFNARKGYIETTNDQAYFTFDYSKTKGDLLASITGKGQNIFGAYKVSGVLKRDSRTTCVFQFCKIFIPTTATTAN